MNIFRHFALTLAFAAAIPLAAQAQRPQVSTVNVTPEEGRVRAAAVGSVFDLRMEVLNDVGEAVFETMQQTQGKPLDWNMRDSRGVRVEPGTYTVIVGYTTAGGRPRKRVEQVLVTEEMTGTMEVEGQALAREGVTAASSSPKASSSAPNPQPLLDGGGVLNRVPKFQDGDTLTSSSIMDVGGNISIGKLAAPVAGVRLEINGYTRMNTAGSGGYMQFGTPNGETGFGWIKGTTSRADVRFNGTALTLAAGTGINVPPNTYGIVITTAGRVGIGTAAPGYKLHVNGGSLTAVYGKSDATGVRGDGATHGVYGNGDIGVYANGGTYGVYGKAFNGVYGTGNIRGVWGVGGTYGVLGTGTDYGVWGNGGKYGVYAYSNSTGLLAEGGVIGIHGRVASGGTAGYFEGPVQVIGDLFATAQVCATNVPCTSDARLKQDVTDLRYGLGQLLRLRPVSWRWKSEPEGKPQMGLVAQEVERVLPELVLKDADVTKPLGLNYMALLPVMVKATQEQQAQIREQQKQIQQLRAELNRVKRTVRRKRTVR